MLRYERRQREGGGRDGGGVVYKRVIRDMMRAKRRNGEREVAKARREMTKDKLEMIREWVDKGKEVLRFTRKVTNRIWEETKEKHRKKRDQDRRRKEREREEGERERERQQFYDLGGGVGVKVGDMVLEDRSDEKPNVLKYGGVEVSSDEEEILRLPAKFKTAPPLDFIDIMTEIQMGGNKARGEMRRERKEIEERERLEALRLSYAAPELTIEEIRMDPRPGDKKFDSET